MPPRQMQPQEAMRGNEDEAMTSRDLNLCIPQVLFSILKTEDPTAEHPIIYYDPEFARLIFLIT
jgi:hypothetical protein